MQANNKITAFDGNYKNLTNRLKAWEGMSIDAYSNISNTLLYLKYCFKHMLYTK